MAKRKILLSEMIVDLRRELLEAQKLGQDEELTFRVEDVELEVQFTAAKEAKAEGGVKFWVCNASAGGKIATETVHKIRFTLKPETLTGGDLRISDQDTRPTD